ncbi:MAG: GntR family transcriptional regulator [Chloroflexi bacterium]|nr:MAG: GntR family transcriptional regulator [Chloroflexota bacterium]
MAPVAVPLAPAEVLAPDRLPDRVAAWLRDAIIGGRLRPGDNLRLATLAQRLGVSTTPVREALVHLHREGLVEGEPRKGFRVAQLRRSDIRDLFQVHAFIAGLLAERAASTLEDPDLDGLGALNADIRAAVGRGDLVTATNLNHELHRTINKAGGATVLHRFLTDMSRWTEPRTAGWPAVAGQDHTPLIRALRRHDGATARNMAERHVRQAGQRVIAHLAESGTVE